MYDHDKFVIILIVQNKYFNVSAFQKRNIFFAYSPIFLFRETARILNFVFASSAATTLTALILIVILHSTHKLDQLTKKK